MSVYTKINKRLAGVDDSIKIIYIKYSTQSKINRVLVFINLQVTNVYNLYEFLKGIQCRTDYVLTVQSYIPFSN